MVLQPASLGTRASHVTIPGLALEVAGKQATSVGVQDTPSVSVSLKLVLKRNKKSENNTNTNIE